MKRFLALLLGLALTGAVSAQATATSKPLSLFYELHMDGVKVGEYTTNLYCEAAAKGVGAKVGKTTVFDCPRRLRYTVAGTPPVVTVPPPVVVTPPVVTTPPATTFSWFDTKAVVKPATQTKPARGVPFVDAAFKTTVVRVTDKVDPPVGFRRNDYSRRQAFSAGNKWQLVYANNGYWHAYDVATNKHVKQLVGLAGDAEPQWHPTNPDLLRYLPTTGVGMKMHELNVATNTSRQIADFAPRLKALWPTAAAAWTKSEGSPSADGRFWCFMVDNASWNSVGLFTYDLQTDTIIATRAMSNRPDHVSMSPSGKYCVTSHTDADPGTAAWARDLKSSKQLLKGSQHSDIALLPDGSDAFVAVDYSDNEGNVFFVNIDTGVRVNLFGSYIGGSTTAFHFSCKAFGRPGWCVMSAYAENPATCPAWMHCKLTAIELKPGGRTLSIAHHRAASGPEGYYFYSPVASWSRDGSLIAFNSTWGGKSYPELDVYRVTVPALPQ